MICIECGNPNMRKTTEKMSEEYRGNKYCIEGIPHYICDNCKEIVYPAESLSMLDEADKFVERVSTSNSDVEFARLDKYLEKDLQEAKENSNTKIPIFRIRRLDKTTDVDFNDCDYNLLAEIVCG